jgi:ribonuclease R
MPRRRAEEPPPGELTRARVLAAIAALGGASDKRELARRLGVKPEERRRLREILQELEAEGALGRVGRRGFASAEAVPDTGVFEVVDRDPDGELLVRFRGREGLQGPPIRLAPGDGRALRGEAAIGVGDRVLARVARGGGEPEARVIKRLGQSAHLVLGVFRAIADPRARGAGRVEPADRKVRHDLLIEPDGRGEAEDGDLVLCELQPGSRPHGPKRARVRERVGRADDPRAASILAIHTHGIPMGFTEEELAEAERAKGPSPSGLVALDAPPGRGKAKRTDLRPLPLLTIDPEDARDHDDAVFALPDDDPTNPGGWRVWVAIADVAAFVTPGSALDRGALKRGNSTYFPDRVAPMLPERLSADLCSLREGEDRACFAVEMVFNAKGQKLRHRFVRGVMRSAAKLSYAQAQAAFEGKPDAKTAPLLEPILKPLWAAYQCMLQGREARQPLDLASSEFRIRFGPDGRVSGVQKREMLEANKLIEEMMIQANVCAAETLEGKNRPLVYRVHDAPSKEKIAQLGDFLETVQLSWAKGQVVNPARFNRLLALSRQTEHADIVNEVVLRTQSQAIYSPENIGHFGLNLAKYAHFTSPIRRYADLVVHRALIAALKLGEDGLTDGEAERLEEIAEHITSTERRSMAAEREATERYIASFLADRVGAAFTARIAGVTRFGAFVKLQDTNADGIVPMSQLTDDRFVHDPALHALVGERSGQRYQLGQTVEVRLLEAAPISGGLVFEMLSEPLEALEGWRGGQPRARFARSGPGPKRAPLRRGKRR